MSDDEKLTMLIDSWLVNKSALAAEDYIRRGRPNASVPVGALKERWVQLMRLLFTGDRSRRLEQDDVGAELELRGEALPVKEIEHEMKDATQKAVERIRRQQREEPEKFEETWSGALEEIEALEQQLKKPSA